MPDLNKALDEAERLAQGDPEALDKLKILKMI